MATVKVGIVEDEMVIATNIVSTLRQLGYDTTTPAVNYTRALEMLAAEQPDVVLIDIMLGGRKDGIDLAAKVKEDFGIPFIFLTANADAATVERAKKLNPPAYLVKPFRKDDLFTAIEICVHNASARQGAEEEPGKRDYLVKDSLFIKHGQRFNKVKLVDILYIEADNVYLNIYTTAQKYIVRNNMQDYLQFIGHPQFVRVHKTYAVNLANIEAVNTESIFVKEIEIPIGRAYRDELMEAIRIS